MVKKDQFDGMFVFVLDWSDIRNIGVGSKSSSFRA